MAGADWADMSLAERLKALRPPDFDPWTAVGCVVGLLISLWFLRKIERRFAELRTQDKWGDDPKDPWLEAQRLAAWLAVIYFGFTCSFIAFAIVGVAVQVLPGWVWLPLLPYGAWRWWQARRGSEETEDEDEAA